MGDPGVRPARPAAAPRPHPVAGADRGGGRCPRRRRSRRRHLSVGPATPPQPFRGIPPNPRAPLRFRAPGLRPAPLPLTHGPTPLEPLDRLSESLGGPRLFVKRDDLTGLALGGNKARKLEHLCAEALAQGCDTLVTGGGPQSNHCRMTAAAANRLGLQCHLALAGRAPEQPTGNLLLDHLLGARLHPTAAREYYEIEASIEAVADEVRAAGGRPYAIPVGGASVTGALGYVDAARELTGQLAESLDWIVVAGGSAGTHPRRLAGQEG